MPTLNDSSRGNDDSRRKYMPILKSQQLCDGVSTNSKKRQTVAATSLSAKAAARASTISRPQKSPAHLQVEPDSITYLPGQTHSSSLRPYSRLFEQPAAAAAAKAAKAALRRPRTSTRSVQRVSRIPGQPADHEPPSGHPSRPTPAQEPARARDDPPGARSRAPRLRRRRSTPRRVAACCRISRRTWRTSSA